MIQLCMHMKSRIFRQCRMTTTTMDHEILLITQHSKNCAKHYTHPHKLDQFVHIFLSESSVKLQLTLERSLEYLLIQVYLGENPPSKFGLAFPSSVDRSTFTFS